jgi:phosphatidylglycerophosphate synthase
MLQALVFEDDAPFLSPGRASGSLADSGAAQPVLAGLTLLQRATGMARRAGAEYVTVVRGRRSPDTPLDGMLPAAPGGPVADEVIDENAPEGWLRPEATQVLILSARVLPTDAAAKALVACGRREEGDSARLPPLVADVDGVRCPGLVGAQVLRRALRSGERLPDCIGRLVREAASPPPDAAFLRGEAYAVVHLGDAETVAAAHRRLYQGLTSVTDGYIDRVFNRHISGWVTRRIIHLPITPNHVTWFHFSLGLLGAWLFWHGGYLWDVLGAFFLQLSVALDCTDGEIARLKYQSSRFGSWLDVAADNVVTVAVFAAVARSAAVHLGTGLALVLGAIAIAGVVCCILAVAAAAQAAQRSARRVAAGAPAGAGLAVVERFAEPVDPTKRALETQRLVDRVINEATSRDFSVLVVAFALLGRLEWFLWLAAVGSHLFWITFTGVRLRLERTGVG